MTDTEFRGYLKGNAVKPLWRYTYEQTVEDLSCRWYLDSTGAIRESYRRAVWRQE